MSQPAPPGAGDGAGFSRVWHVADLLLIPGEQEPVFKDARIAEALGFDRPRNIRQLIDRNSRELSGYSELRCTVQRMASAAGRTNVIG